MSNKQNVDAKINNILMSPILDTGSGDSTIVCIQQKEISMINYDGMKGKHELLVQYENVSQQNQNLPVERET